MIRSDQAHAVSHRAHSKQFELLGQRRFAPFFWTQFLGAGNDNLFKFAFVMLVTYQAIHAGWLPHAAAGSIINGVFVLPFLLFSATAGQLTDKFSKTRMIRSVKLLEIGIMLLALWGFYASSALLLMVCTFLMGLHSTLFGPVKYAYLPHVLHERELVGGNGMVEMGTFVAILLGQIGGTLLIALPEGVHYVAWACVGVALLGWLVAQGVPQVGASDAQLVINWNPLSETWRNLKQAHQIPVVFRSLLGISWLWFFGAAFTAQFPALASEVLHGNSQVAASLLVAFSIGIAIGSLLCEKLSNGQVEIGLVPLGAIGMTVFAISLYGTLQSLPPAPPANAPYTLAQFLAIKTHWKLLLDLALLALFAGLFSVPMYALVQLRSPPTHRARMIATNNILNALFMIASAGIVTLLLAMGVTLPTVFLLVGIANGVVALYIFLLVPEYLLRFVAWVLTHLVYRFRIQGRSHIPPQGAAILAANHVSFVDPILLMAASPRPIRFIMDYRIFQNPFLGWLFKLGKAIPIAPKQEDAALYEQAMRTAQEVLAQGDLLGIFPEGGITRDGQLQPFKGGIMRILEDAAAGQIRPPVVPMALINLWGSFFSRIDGKAMLRPFRRGFFSHVGLYIDAPISANEVGVDTLQSRISDLLQKPV